MLSLTNDDDWVLDPFLGVGTSIIATIRHGRRGVGAESVKKYINIANDRIQQEINGTLRTRPMHKPVYDPQQAGNRMTMAPWITKQDAAVQMTLLKEQNKRSTAE